MFVTGCDAVSPGCANCYAARLSATRLKHSPKYAGVAVREPGQVPRFTGKILLHEDALMQPLRVRKPTTWFVNSMGDTFHEDVPFEFLDRAFAVMALCPQHTFIVLTKRSARQREYVSAFVAGKRNVTSAATNLIAPSAAPASRERGEAQKRAMAAVQLRPMPNVWLGVSAENQEQADARIPDLLATPAAVRWLSCEPLLGHVVFDEVPRTCTHGPGFQDPETGAWSCGECERATGLEGIDWVVCGGEADLGKRSRGMHPEWARSLRDQCQSAGVPFFFKQWGDYGPMEVPMPEDWEFSDGVRMNRFGKKAAGRLLDGRTWDEMPKVKDVVRR